MRIIFKRIIYLFVMQNIDVIGKVAFALLFYEFPKFYEWYGNGSQWRIYFCTGLNETGR